MRETTGHQWIPLTKTSDAELWCILWYVPEQTVEKTIETAVIWDDIPPIMTSLYWVGVLVWVRCWGIILDIIKIFRKHLTHYFMAWWRHQMETFSALLVICAGNSPVPGEFPTQRPVTRSFDAYFDLRPNKRLSKQSWDWCFETLSLPLWRLSVTESPSISPSLPPAKLIPICSSLAAWQGLSCENESDALIVRVQHQLLNRTYWNRVDGKARVGKLNW